MPRLYVLVIRMYLNIDTVVATCSCSPRFGSWRTTLVVDTFTIFLCYKQVRWHLCTIAYNTWVKTKQVFGRYYVCMVITHHTSHIARVSINPRLPILLVVSLTGKMKNSLSPFAPVNLVSRDGFGSPVPRQPAHLHTQAESGAYLRDSSRFLRRRPFIYLNSHTPSGQSRVFRVTQLRTDGVNCRESAGTGPVNLKVVPVTGAAVASP